MGYPPSNRARQRRTLLVGNCASPRWGRRSTGGPSAVATNPVTNSRLPRRWSARSRAPARTVDVEFDDAILGRLGAEDSQLVGARCDFDSARPPRCPGHYASLTSCNIQYVTLASWPRRNPIALLCRSDLALLRFLASAFAGLSDIPDDYLEYLKEACAYSLHAWCRAGKKKLAVDIVYGGTGKHSVQTHTERIGRDDCVVVAGDSMGNKYALFLSGKRAQAVFFGANAPANVLSCPTSRHLAAVCGVRAPVAGQSSRPREPRRGRREWACARERDYHAPSRRRSHGVALRANPGTAATVRGKVPLSLGGRTARM
jgi:hypothetical protein